MDRQTVFKESPEYYRIHKEILLAKGYKITQDTLEYTVFEEQDKDKNTPNLTIIS